MSEKALTLADLMPFVCEVYDENDEGWCGWRPPVDRGEWDAVSGDDGGEGALWRIRRSQLAEREAELENEREYTAQYKAGAQALQVEVERLRGELRDEQIARWHERGNDDDPPLHEWLGMTWDEYAAWVQHPQAEREDR